MKISQALQVAQKKLQEKNIDNPAFEALILLMSSTSFTKEKIVFNPDLLLEKNQENDFFAKISRRQNREPVSHIIGKREFYGYDFVVTKNVLDPRPDSEALVELVLENIANKTQELKILELGVGSGCLTISLLKNLPNASATGVDISPKALEIAQKNAANNQVENRFKLLESNLFSALEVEAAQKRAAQKFDIIISNPPYIPAAEIENLSDEVRLFEPRLALDGGIDGLDFYRQIAAQAKNFLTPQGLVFLEVGHDQSRQVSEIFAAQEFEARAIKRDLAGFERALMFEIARSIFI